MFEYLTSPVEVIPGTGEAVQITPPLTTPVPHAAELEGMLALSQELPEQCHTGERRASEPRVRTTGRGHTGESPCLTDPHPRTVLASNHKASAAVGSGVGFRFRSGDGAAANAGQANLCGETDNVPQMCWDGSDSRAAQKQKQHFQTVNHARVLWDVKRKPKGILGGQLNIRSLIPKRDQVSALLLDSNLDYLCLTESWLHCNIPTTMIDIAGFSSLSKVNYGATSSVLSNKLQYPSFVRTIPCNKNLIEMIIHIIRWFGWNWVAFLGSQDDYSSDGLKLFNEYISNTGICLAYQERLSLNANYSLTLQKIDMLNINVIVVFAVPQYASKIIKAAIANNIQDKVWIASQAWSMNQQIPREPGIGKIGTIIGITERLLSLPGFNEFVYKDRRTTDVNHYEESDIQSTSRTCNQVCDYCTMLTAEEIINENPTFSFAIYAAIYTIAHALHKVLQCDMNECRKNTPVKPYMLLGEIKKLDFPLNGRQVKYDDNYDPTISYAVVLWHTDVNPPQFEMVGTYDTYPEVTFTINNSLLPWHNNGSVPFSNCSAECKEGFSRQPEGFHSCCFTCKECPCNSYVNYSQSSNLADSALLASSQEEQDVAVQGEYILMEPSLPACPAYSDLLEVMAILSFAEARKYHRLLAAD
ncbi:taste receptor type 1 member 1-like [Megalobrama amblycephala]|uniref:taste receptor type 1 member 1-like n=1 Tax=Megalobrama amblycephala TaxID=75352 RepID=UPI002013C9BB|nr:taste receptor type 1 member 1-like [Megalobrama amblycephala]